MRVFALTVSFLRGFVASKKCIQTSFLPPEICLFCDVIQGIQKEVRITPDMCYQALFDGLILTKNFVTIIEQRISDFTHHAAFRSKAVPVEHPALK
ncbi:hypothetical protein AB2F45_02850 [Escherichia coli]